eukprot:g24237.t1
MLQCSVLQLENSSFEGGLETFLETRIQTLTFHRPRRPRPSLANTLQGKCRPPPLVKLITVPSDLSLAETLALLDKHNIQSCPVMHTTQPNKVVGAINVIDILTRVVFDKVFSEDGVSLTDLAKEHGDLLKKLTVADARGLSLEGRKTCVVRYNDSLLVLMTAMCCGVHRVLVERAPYDTPEKKNMELFKGYLSQADLLRFLVDKKDPNTMTVLDKPVSEVAKSKVLFVRQGTTAVTTFRKMMQENEMSALPIVDHDGVLCDTVSVSDIKKLHGEHVEHLNLPIEDFVKLTGSRADKTKRFNVKCKRTDKKTDKVGQVLALLLGSKVHRAWVCDDNNKPVGALAFTDILRAIFFSS